MTWSSRIDDGLKSSEQGLLSAAVFLEKWLNLIAKNLIDPGVLVLDDRLTWTEEGMADDESTSKCLGIRYLGIE